LTEDKLLTGARLKDMVKAGYRCLTDNKEAVNTLNVFPVPDGDTGTNMCLTVAAAVREMDKVTSSGLGEVVKALALGSLMGARGNSGVILSQLFRGLSRSLQDRRTASPLQFAWAMQEGVETAYKAVMKPAEGTILTVAREAARASLAAAKKGADLEGVLSAALERGREVLDKTPEMLAVLKQAGVVDAGGAGLVFLLEGAVQGLSGALVVPGEREEAPLLRGEPEAGPAVQAGDGAAEPSEPDIVFAYDTQLLVRGAGLEVDRIRSQLEPLGDSLLVVGERTLVKVHVHTNEPDRVLAVCLAHGDLLEASVENMREQRDARRHSRVAVAGAAGAASGGAASEEGRTSQFVAPADPGPSADSARLGVVVVSTGDGLEAVFRNLGADVIVSGGQTMNPSTEDLLAGVESLPAEEVLLLPNNSNILMAAEQTRELTSKTVHVVPTRSIPQGIAAMVSFNRSLDGAENAVKMKRALARVKSGEVTYAVRDSKYNDIEIHEGDFIGLLDRDIVTVGSDPLTVLAGLVGRMADAETEIVTVFYGAEVTEEEAAQIESRLSAKAPGHEIEVHRGGQPVYRYLVSVE